MSPSTYIIHFSTNYKHAKHYAGWTPGKVEDRIELHKSGKGSRLCQVVVDAGIELILAKSWTWKTQREAIDHERKLKRHGLSRYCPICKEVSHNGTQDTSRDGCSSRHSRS